MNVKGPKGELSTARSRKGITAKVEDASARCFERPGRFRSSAKSSHGLARALANNMVVGVSEGFTKPARDRGRRLSRRREGQDPQPAARLLASRRDADSRGPLNVSVEAEHEGRHRRRGQAGRRPVRGRRASPFGRRSPIRARASATTTNTFAARSARQEPNAGIRVEMKKKIAEHQASQVDGAEGAHADRTLAERARHR